MDEQEKCEETPTKLRKLDTSETKKRASDDSWTPDWAKNKAVHLCPNDWCTYNAVGRPRNMKRHEKVCQKKFTEGLRLQHTGGEFAPSRLYVQISEHGMALDNSICKQEPIFDEYGQEPEHFFESPPSPPPIEEMTTPIHKSTPLGRKRKLIDIDSSFGARKPSRDTWTPDWAEKGSINLCPNWWCTYNTIGGKNIARHRLKCNVHYKKGLRLHHEAGNFNAHNGTYVSIEEEGLAVDGIVCKQEEISEETPNRNDYEPLTPPALEELIVQADKSTQCDISSEAEKSSETALYASLLDTTEQKIKILLKIYGSYEKVLQKLDHRLNK